MELGPKGRPCVGQDMLYEVMLNTNYKDMKAVAQVNKGAYEIYKSNKFWQNKFEKDFGKPNYTRRPTPHKWVPALPEAGLVLVKKWKQEYKIRYAITHQQKLYRLVDITDKTNVLNLRVKSKKEAYQYIAHAINHQLIDERHIKTLAIQIGSFETAKHIFDIQKLLTYCEQYYKNNKEKIDCYNTGGDPNTFLAEHCYLGYLRPAMLHYRPPWMIADFGIIVDFFNYLYSQGVCSEKVTKPFSLPIDRNLTFTPNDIEIMLNNRNAWINLIEENCVIEV